MLGITKNICSFLKQFQLHQGFRLTYEVVQLVKRFHFFFWGGGEGQYFRTAFQTETISILIVDVSDVMHQLNHIDGKLSNLHV